MSLTEKFAQLDGELRGRFDQALKELRDGMRDRLRESHEELLRKLDESSLDLPEQILPPEAVSALEAGEVEARQGTWKDFRSMLRRFDGATSQAEVLEALIEECHAFAGRSLLFLVREDQATAWGGSGWQGDVSSLSFDYTDEEAWSQLAGGSGAVTLDAAACAAVCSRLEAPVAQEGVLIPLVLRDRIAAALYADRREGEKAFGLAGLQSLTYLAAQAIETLTFRNRSLTPTLWESDEAPDSLGALPLWDGSPEADHHDAVGDEAGDDAAQAADEIAAAEVESGEDAVAEAPPTPGFGVIVPPPSEALESAEAATEAPAFEVTVPEEAVSDDSEGGTAEPEPVVSEAIESLVEATAPETAVPEIAAPEVSVPEIAAPEIAAPEAPPEAQVTEPEAEVESTEAPVSDAAATAEAAADSSAEAAEDTSAALADLEEMELADADSSFWSMPEDIAAEADKLTQSEPEADPEPPPLSSTQELGEVALEAAAEAAEGKSPSEGGGEPAHTFEIPAAPGISGDETVMIDRSRFPSAFGDPPTQVAPATPEPAASEAPAEQMTDATVSGQAQVQPPSDLEGPGWAFANADPPPADSADDAEHEEARRLARLLVSEIRLYNEEQVEEGRRSKDIYRRLKDDIDRSRQMYEERVSSGIAASTDYFQQELVRILGAGDAAALGM